jgi:leader peptidase (prepilin peptidase)/N-methyltransferase
VLAPHTLPVAVDPALVSILLDWKLQAAAFVWGLLWGSFANVVIYRVPRNMSVVKPRSRCGGCERPIAWYDNVPVLSYLLLRGQCRHCGEPFALRYLMVELLGGVLSFSLWMLLVVKPLVAGGGAEGVIAWALWFVFCLAMLVVIYIDLDAWIVPNSITLPLAAMGLGIAAYDPELLGVDWKLALIGGAGGYGVILLLRIVYSKLRGLEAMGLGDAKLLMAIGVWGGPAGAMWGLFAGSMHGVLVAIPMLAMGRDVANSDLRDVHGEDPELGEEDPDRGVVGMRVPFGPFMAISALEFVLLRPQLESFFGWLFVF